MSITAINGSSYSSPTTSGAVAASPPPQPQVSPAPVQPADDSDDASQGDAPRARPPAGVGGNLDIQA